MNRGELIDEIRRLILDTDTTNPRWSTTVLQDRLNLSHDRIATLARCITDRITDGIDIDTAEYALPDYFLEARMVAIKDDGATTWTAINKVSQEELENYSETWMNDEGTPTKYYLRSHKIGLYPIPDYTKSSALRIDIIRRPDEFTADEDVPFEGIPSLYAYHNILSFDVARMCAMDEGNTPKVAIFSNEVDRILRQINYILAADEEATRIPNIYEQVRTPARRVR